MHSTSTAVCASCCGQAVVSCARRQEHTAACAGRVRVREPGQGQLAVLVCCGAVNQQLLLPGGACAGLRVRSLRPLFPAAAPARAVPWLHMPSRSAVASQLASVERRQCFEVKCVDAAPFQGRCNSDQVRTCTRSTSGALVARPACRSRSSAQAAAWAVRGGSSSHGACRQSEFGEGVCLFVRVGVLGRVEAPAQDMCVC